jgi:N6-L-threonylcarbamoyladenine synthase
VAANSGLKKAVEEASKQYNWKIYIPKFEYTMDNAAMIAIVGYYHYMKGNFQALDSIPHARFKY